MLKALKEKMKDQRGLTLIELLAVIVILGIIAAIAIPSIGGIINKSKNDAKVAEAVQIINAAKLAHSSKSDVVSWTHTTLGDYVSNVKDAGLDYVVDYDATNKRYTIKNHDAASIVTHAATDTTVTEAELLAHTR
ncbi:prepilin-type N-terminal cleavage/methylation domain-containing protein [Mesobacillus boroniphilus]|uniref:Prepilin-type N-terminal cleavage/methylation domain-containing protein n=1 Tax=Mesobacillus boroniphilus TaxID=308892 RepID=A0A944CKN0_9BACI|nr:prepilin-type N-terminal cleavage/methylation domain-containing protein [Mesobacillus boroniphilus]MBS8265080.1 prepilin-type N-terminal cleavage/methylation domain-containing protein [Mesobacillus boroniphilus]